MLPRLFSPGCNMHATHGPRGSPASTARKNRAGGSLLGVAADFVSLLSEKILNP